MALTVQLVRTESSKDGPLLGINVSGNDFSQGWHTVALEGSKWVTGGQFGFEASLPGKNGSFSMTGNTSPRPINRAHTRLT